MAKGLGEQNREWFARYKDDVKKEGKAFFPRAMLHDTVMGFVVVGVIIGLAVIWYYGAGDSPEGEGLEPGILGPLYAEPAEPGTTDFIPRPDWYFYFLFYLLRIFEWPETVVIATVGIPTVLLVLLLGLPFYDRRRERRPSRRPVAMVAALLTVLSMGVLTYKGATAEESLGSTLIADGVPPSGQKSRASQATSRRRPARRSSPRPGACSATSISASARAPGRPRSLGDRADQRRRVLRAVPRQPLAVREQRDGLVLVPRRGEPRGARRVPRGVEGRRVRIAVGRGMPRPCPDSARIPLNRAHFPRRDRRLRRSVRRALASRSRRR